MALRLTNKRKRNYSPVTRHPKDRQHNQEFLVNVLPDHVHLFLNYGDLQDMILLSKAALASWRYWHNQRSIWNWYHIAHLPIEKQRSAKNIKVDFSLLKVQLPIYRILDTVRYVVFCRGQWQFPKFNIEEQCQFLPSELQSLTVEDNLDVHLKQDLFKRMTHLCKLKLLSNNTYGRLGVLPNTLTHLEFGTIRKRSEQSEPVVISMLPPKLATLIVRLEVTLPLPMFGECLQHLVLNQDIDRLFEMLPNGLRTLSLGGRHIGWGFGNWPPILEELCITGQFDLPNNPLPTNLRILRVTNHMYNQSLGILPSSLEKLIISSCCFNQPLGILPNNLRVLKCKGSDFNMPLGPFPHVLEELSLNGHKFNQPLEKFGSNLLSLVLGASFVQPLNLSSSNLKTVKIYSRYPASLMGSFPSSLSYLHLYRCTLVNNFLNMAFNDDNIKFRFSRYKTHLLIANNCYSMEHHILHRIESLQELLFDESIGLLRFPFETKFSTRHKFLS